MYYRERIRPRDNSDWLAKFRTDMDAFGFYGSNHGQRFQLLENDGMHEKIDRLLGMVGQQGNMIAALQMKHQKHVSSITEVSKVLESVKKDVGGLKTAPSTISTTKSCVKQVPRIICVSSLNVCW